MQFSSQQLEVLRGSLQHIHDSLSAVNLNAIFPAIYQLDFDPKDPPTVLTPAMKLELQSQIQQRLDDIRQSLLQLLSLLSQKGLNDGESQERNDH